MPIHQFRNLQQEQTYNEIIALLKKHNKCGVERPVGFGKTWLFALISALYKKTLFIVPNQEIERAITDDYEDMRCQNIEIFKYYGTGTKHKKGTLIQELLKKDFDLIVLDEVHCAGAEQAKTAIKAAMPTLIAKGVHFLGGTATNDRMDGYDPIADMFDNIQPFIYTMDNMLKDKLAPAPYYTYATYQIKSVSKYVQGALQLLPSTFNIHEFEPDMSKIEKAMAEKSNAADVIQQAVYNVIPPNELEYLKFVIYMPTHRVLDEKTPEMINAFKTAFPHMDVRDPLIVTSRRQDAKNIKELNAYRHKQDTTDLILCVNQINLGYHVEDLTGVCLMRLTDSAIIGKQQAYRPIIAGATRPGIIIDFVDCLHKSFVFQDNTTTGKRSNNNQGIDQLRNVRVANVVLKNTVASEIEMLANLEGVISARAEKEILEMYDMSGMEIDMIVSKLSGGGNRSRVRNLLYKNNMIDENENRLVLYGKPVSHYTQQP